VPREVEPFFSEWVDVRLCKKTATLTVDIEQGILKVGSVCGAVRKETKIWVHN
jgi:hypothetical protein